MFFYVDESGHTGANRSGTGLKEFVYQTFPELTEMKWGEEIEI